jgi:hypothetical protein
MPLFKKVLLVIFAVSPLMLVGCAPEVGSDAWCEDMKAKPKGDWSSNDAADFAQHCLFK